MILLFEQNSVNGRAQRLTVPGSPPVDSAKRRRNNLCTTQIRRIVGAGEPADGFFDSIAHVGLYVERNSLWNGWTRTLRVKSLSMPDGFR